MNETGNRKRRTLQLTAALVLFALCIYAMTFFKLPVWLPALK